MNDFWQAIIALVILFPVWGSVVYLVSNTIRAKFLLDKNVPLPAGCKWEAFSTEIRLMVNVNHGTGSKPDWRRGLLGLSDSDVQFHSHRFPDEFVDTSNSGIITMGRWMREQYINTDEFTTPIPFPVEDGAWEITSKHGTREVVVNGFRIGSAEFGDHRDAISAMIAAYPLIIKAEQKQLAQQRKGRSLDRALQGTNAALTTREHKDASMDAVKRQYLSA